MAKVTLRGVTEENMWDICSLKTTKEQENYVAPNPYSLAQARFSDNAWYRAIYADETPVGFMMVHEQPNRGQYYLWRFLMDYRYQGKGYGKEAMHQLIERIKQNPKATSLSLSCVPGEGGPEKMYLNMGFAATGEMDGDEQVMILRWGEKAEYPEPRVSLKAVTNDNLRDIFRLKVKEDQQGDVIDNIHSIAESMFNSLLQLRAIYAGDTAVGFMMWEDNPQKGEYFLWRLLIGADHQGQGYGQEAMGLLIDLVRNRPRAKELLTSFVPGSRPESFYTKLGFVATGRFIDEEQVYTLPL